MALEIFVTREIPPDGIALLRESGAHVVVNPHDRALSADELSAFAAKADGLVTMLVDQVNAKLLDNCPNVKAISNYAVGFNNIDVPECTRRKIGVTNTPGVLTNATAETAWALLFAVARRIVESDNFLRMGHWDGWAPMQFLGRDIIGKTLGVIGAGRIGERFAYMSRGFDMPILYTARRDHPAMNDNLGARRVPLPELLKRADYISIHVPLTPETRHLIGAHELGHMKDTAVLINTARGPIIDEAALGSALMDHQIGGAGLDVFEFEPKVRESLLGLKNVVLLPHIGSATVETRTKMSVIVANEILAMLNGRRPANPLNPELWP